MPTIGSIFRSRKWRAECRECCAHLHMQIRTLWSSSRTADVVPLSERLLDFAIASDDAALMLATRLSLAPSTLHLLCRYDEAKRYLYAIDENTLPQDSKMRSKYYRVCALAFTSSGNGDMAFREFLVRPSITPSKIKIRMHT